MKIQASIVAGVLVWAVVAGIAFGQGEPPKVETMAPAGPTVQATPALWKMKGEKGTVYLFGTVHVMKKEIHWETAKIADALKSSGTLWLEIDDTTDAGMAKLRPTIMQIGLDQAHPLSTKLTKEDLAALGAAMAKMGATEAQVEPMQPWLVYLTLSVLPIVQAGYDPASGIDRVLQAEAVAAGKPVKGFETAEQQLHFMADFPQTDQVAMLHEELSELPDAVEKTNEMVVDWEKGDVEKIAAMENDDMMKKEPALYKKLLVDRNAAIAGTIAGMLKDPSTGTVFVAVGAAHLAGPDSILKMLSVKGFPAERVQ
jgi:uncharacterized protein YbaP (TraB family)